MKIYEMVKIDIYTGEIIDESFYEYTGAVSECKGGGSGSSVDRDYNARMANIAESQQEMAQNYFDWYLSDYRPMEEAQIASNMKLIPQQTALQSAEIEAATSLIPQQTALQKSQIQTAIGLLPQQAKGKDAFYQQAMSGINVNQRADRAQADVAHAFAGTMDAANRQLARRGVGPDSAAYQGQINDNAIERAKAMGGARTSARIGAEQENFSRLHTAFGGI